MDTAERQRLVAIHGLEYVRAKCREAKRRRRAALYAQGLKADGRPRGPQYDSRIGNMGRRKIDGMWHPADCPCYDCLALKCGWQT